MARYFDKLLEAALKGESLRHKDIEAAYLAAYRTKAQTKIKKAIAEKYKTATMIGTATASVSNATQQELIIDLLPFNVVNGNKQAIDISEKENLLMTAIAQPITANFDGRLHGHKDTKPYGAITKVIDNGDRLTARAVLWVNDDSEDLIEHIRDNGTVGSSFEILYGRSESRNGAVWLYDTVFYSQALVHTPAYGDKTKARLV